VHGRGKPGGPRRETRSKSGAVRAVHEHGKSGTIRRKTWRFGLARAALKTQDCPGTKHEKIRVVHACRGYWRLVDIRCMQLYVLARVEKRIGEGASTGKVSSG
jgi:hypothetical protein